MAQSSSRFLEMYDLSRFCFIDVFFCLSEFWTLVYAYFYLYPVLEGHQYQPRTSDVPFCAEEKIDTKRIENQI